MFAAGLVTIGAAPFLIPGRAFDDVIPIRITTRDLATTPSVVLLDETNWPSGSVSAELDSTIERGIIALARQSRSNDPFVVYGGKELDLTALEWVFINLVSLQKNFDAVGVHNYDSGDEEIFTAETVLSFAFQQPRPGTRVDPLSVELIANLFATSPGIDARFENARHNAITNFIREGLRVALSDYREEFAKLRLAVEQAGFSKSGSIGPLNQIPTDALEAQREKLAELDRLLEKWSALWKPVRMKRLSSRDEIPNRFRDEAGALFGTNTICGNSVSNIASFFHHHTSCAPFRFS